MGDLRSLETDRDRWVALIVPQSDVDREKEAEQQDNQPPDPPKPPEFEFRQCYVVQLNMAGRFAFPALLIEPTTPPIQSLRAEQSSVEIRPPEIPR
jgi:hypothetical protein